MTAVWRSVRGPELVVGMRLRFGNTVSTLVDVVDVPAMVDGDRVIVPAYRRAVLDRGHGFVIGDRTPYRVLHTAPLSHGGEPVNVVPRAYVANGTDRAVVVTVWDDRPNLTGVSIIARRTVPDGYALGELAAAPPPPMARPVMPAIAADVGGAMMYVWHVTPDRAGEPSAHDDEPTPGPCTVCGETIDPDDGGAIWWHPHNGSAFCDGDEAPDLTRQATR